ncbi:MAG: arginine--tRNA ligase [Bacteroides sp.]
MDLLLELRADVEEALRARFGAQVDTAPLVLQTTREEFEGDYTLVVFPWIKLARSKPEVLAEELGQWLVEHSDKVQSFNVVKGFLNLSLKNTYLCQSLLAIRDTESWGNAPKNGRKVMVEYSSPNTNKPLHLGHIRNNLLGWSVSRILEAAGTEVVMANLVNDRGIHICKSMVAWLRYGNGATPDSTGQKGDHFVGDYYVRYDKAYRDEVKALEAKGLSEDDAKKQAPILLEAQELLRKWEAGDQETRALWATMNAWVYKGFDETYTALGIHFDKIYYESETYLLGKKIVEDGLARGVLTRHPDGSVWVDLRDEGLDEKLLLRSDGTSVYMTQDLGTAVERFNEYKLDDMVYVVGNEQEYHFQVLRKLLARLGYAWSERIFHLSYGMITLPEGKMKSREGTVVDADDLIAELIDEATKIGQEQGKAAELPAQEAKEIYRKVALGALKYYMLKIDPAKGMMFNPQESVDFNGNTGPFLQYTCARAYSILRKQAQVVATLPQYKAEGCELNRYERVLILALHEYGRVIQEAAARLSPAIVANYIYELASRFNQFYHECPIAREENNALQKLRLILTQSTVRVLRSGLLLLGIEAPEQM